MVLNKKVVSAWTFLKFLIKDFILTGELEIGWVNSINLKIYCPSQILPMAPNEKLDLCIL